MIKETVEWTGDDFAVGNLETLKEIRHLSWLMSQLENDVMPNVAHAGAAAALYTVWSELSDRVDDLSAVAYSFRQTP